MKKYDVIIIGAGAAGLMCAIEAGKQGRNVLVLDKAEKVGKKILISGGGRCNFTNLYTSPDDYLSQNPHFCKSALSRYTQWDFIALLEKHGLTWTEKSLGQLFCDQKAGAIVKVLLDECQSVGVEIKLRHTLDRVSKKSNLFYLTTNQGGVQTSSLVIATGGPSIPAMGSSDFALQIAHQFSINTHPFTPALVPFTFQPQSSMNDFCKDLSGISLLAEICTSDDKSFKEALLFTHRGISGPVALQASSYWKEGQSIEINLLPNDDVYSWLAQQQQSHPKSALKTILSYKLPKRLANKICDSQKILSIKNQAMKTYSDKEVKALAAQLTHWRISPAGTEGMRTAEVSLGGIDTDALSSKTFEAKTVKGLYFIGEGVDVTGHLGGFNFQWAWASGWCAGQFA